MVLLVKVLFYLELNDIINVKYDVTIIVLFTLFKKNVYVLKFS